MFRQNSVKMCKEVEDSSMNQMEFTGQLHVAAALLSD